MTKKVKFMCTAFRDGFQSVYGARVFTQDFLPAVQATQDAGISWFEAGGGARFQSLYFYSLLTFSFSVQPFTLKLALHSLAVMISFSSRS